MRISESSHLKCPRGNTSKFQLLFFNKNCQEIGWRVCSLITFAIIALHVQRKRILIAGDIRCCFKKLIHWQRPKASLQKKRRQATLQWRACAEILRRPSNWVPPTSPRTNQRQTHETFEVCSGDQEAHPRRPRKPRKCVQEAQEVPIGSPRRIPRKAQEAQEVCPRTQRSMQYVTWYLSERTSDPKTEIMKFWKFAKKQIPSSFCWGLDAVRNPWNRSDGKPTGANGTQTNVRTTRNRQSMRPRKPQMKNNYLKNWATEQWIA